MTEFVHFCTKILYVCNFFQKHDQTSTQNAIAKPLVSEWQWKPYQKEGDRGNLRDSQSTCVRHTYSHNVLQDQ